MKVSILDYGAGNIHSIESALNFLGLKSEVCSSKEKLLNADCILVPGVGAFAEGMKNIRELSLVDPIKKAVLENKVPYLGICLGMQYLADMSEEDGLTEGFGFIPGRIKKIEATNLSVPNVGWRSLEIDASKNLFKENKNERYFYFDHSYQYEASDAKTIVASFDYEKKIIAAVGKDNIMGVQFHPEKSQIAGLRFFKNYFKSIGF